MSYRKRDDFCILTTVSKDDIDHINLEDNKKCREQK